MSSYLAMNKERQREIDKGKQGTLLCQICFTQTTNLVSRSSLIVNCTPNALWFKPLRFLFWV